MGSIDIDIDRFLKNKRIDVPSNIADLVEWNNIIFLEKENLFPLSESYVPVYSELSINDFDNIVLTENKKVYDYSNVYAQGLHLYDENAIKERGTFPVSAYYSEGKWYLSELYGNNSRHNLIVPIAKKIMQEHPEIKFPSFLCRIRNYQFKEDEIKPEVMEKIKFLLLEIKKINSYSDSYIDSYLYIRNGSVEGVLWGWWPNKEGLQFEFEIRFKEKKQLEKLIEDLKKIEIINTTFGKNTVNIILNNDHQSFQFEYKGRIIDSNEIKQILQEEKNKTSNQIPLRNEVNKETNIFKELQLEQSTKLTAKEKDALVRYKSQLYYPMNKIISLIRNRGGKVEEEELEKYIKEGYKQLSDAYECHPQLHSYVGNTTISNEETNEKRIFGSIGFPTYEIYKDTVINNIPKVTLALRRVHLKEDLTVYRYVKNDSFYELGEGFLSTSISIGAASNFYNGRDSKGKNPILYKIKLLKGSPIAFFSEELRTGKVNPDEPFKEDQREVLIDSKNFDFKIESVKKYEYLRIDGKKCPRLYFAEVTAIPKILEMDKLIEDKQSNGRSK